MPKNARIMYLHFGGLLNKLCSRLLGDPQRWVRKDYHRMRELLGGKLGAFSQLSPCSILLFHGERLYAFGHLNESFIHFSCAFTYGSTLACSWLSMFHLGAGELSVDRAVSFAESAYPSVCASSEFTVEIGAETLKMFPALVIYMDPSNISLNVPPGINHQVQASIDASGRILVIQGDDFMDLSGLSPEKVLENGIEHYEDLQPKSAWLCFFLLMTVNFKPGFAWMGRLYSEYQYEQGYPVIQKDISVVTDCIFYSVLTGDYTKFGEYAYAEFELDLAKTLWDIGWFSVAEWFYILAEFHGGFGLKDLSRKRLERSMQQQELGEGPQEQEQVKPSFELERARELMVCGQYQQAKWYYCIAVLKNADVSSEASAFSLFYKRR